MNAHDRRQLDGFEYLGHARPGRKRILHVAAHARRVEMRGRGIDRDQDQLLVLLLEGPTGLRYAAKREVSLEEIRVQLLEPVPQRIPVAFCAVRVGVWINLVTCAHASTPAVLERVAAKAVERGRVDLDIDHRGFAAIERRPHGVADLAQALDPVTASAV